MRLVSRGRRWNGARPCRGARRSLRGGAGQDAVLDDLGPSAAADVARLRGALGDADATRLPALADAHQHLGRHPDLVGQIDAVVSATDQGRAQSEQHRRADPA
ncbi:hypothetical protein ACIA5C_47580 [Actinoplanes sp. NPDC051343]|uniref:hypothetical protein n=1 Tax=Actinoplanes sp. NPDC051343 TaxID=3363906 RepID=UPI0037BE1938